MEFSKLADILSCPVCLELASPPIFQCSKGHLICNRCIDEIKEEACPICRVKIYKQEDKRIRSLGFEQLHVTLEVRCKNADKGCKTVVKVEAIKNHLQSECVYETRNFCQLMGSKFCTLEVSIGDLPNHLCSNHGACVMTHAEGAFSPGGYNFELDQSATTGDLMSYPEASLSLAWEPAFLLSSDNNRIYVLQTMYSGQERVLSWTLACVAFEKQGPELFECAVVPYEKDPLLQREMRCTRKMEQVSFGSPHSFLELSSVAVTKWKEGSVCSAHLSFMMDIPTDAVTGRKNQELRVWKLYVRMFSIGEKGNEHHSSVSMSSHAYSICDVGRAAPKEKDVGDVVFGRVACAACFVLPITGICYSCSECDNHNLCGSCVKSGIHDHHIMIRKRYKSPSEDLKPTNVVPGAVDHGGVTCDTCGHYVYGIRFKCVTCYDFDICETCQDNGSHSRHWVLRIPIASENRGRRLIRAVRNIPDNFADKLQRLATNTRGPL